MSKANYDLPEETLLKVKKLIGAKTKRQAIITAMEEFIQRKKIEKLIASEGKISLKWTKKRLKKYRG